MKTLLILNIAPELEEDLVDYLLLHEGVEGFSSYEIRGHGQFDNLTIAEQVSGRQRRLKFELLIDDDYVSDLISGLVEGVGTDIVYWQIPADQYGKT